MNILKEIFAKTKFEDDEIVLVPFEDYFDKENRSYCKFALDEEDIPLLTEFGKAVKDTGGEIFVSIYGYELEHRDGSGFAYGDCLWIRGVSIGDVSNLITLCGSSEPTKICTVEELPEFDCSSVFIVKYKDNKNGTLEEYCPKDFNTAICLYWD